MSILLFYLRVFSRPVFRAVVLWNIAFVGVTAIASILVIIFQCSPVSGIWDKTITSKCIDANALAYSVSGIGIVQDLLILFLPVSELATLRMNLRKKLNVIGMFSIGGL
jgi:hypothetical protein